MDRLQRLMQKLPPEIDAALITSQVNRKYFTGFASSAGVILASREKTWLIVDSRYLEAAQHAVTNCEVILQNRLYHQAGELMKKNGLKTLAIESERMTLQELLAWRKNAPGVTLVEDDGLSCFINQMRSVKTPEEVACIRRAQELTDRTFTYILDLIRPGRTEREMALEMEFYSRKLGSEGPPFDFKFVSGRNTSLPHGSPTDKEVEAGDFITMDFGCIVGGYCSDMTRSVAVGHVSDRQREVHATVLKAQLAALEEIRAGRVCREIDQVARDIIDDSPYSGTFGHGLGHALGMEVHEEPRFSTACETVLEPGMVLSVEPGIYLPGEFGVRIEDIVVITGEGCDNLATSNKELLIL